VQALVEVSGTGGSVAGEGQVDVRPAPHLERQGESGSAGNPRCHRAVAIGRNSEVIHIGEEEAEIAAARGRFVLAHPSSHYLFRPDYTIEPGSQVARDGREEIAFLQQAYTADRRCLLARAEIDGAKDLALSIKRCETLLEGSGQTHRAVKFQQLLPG